MAASSHTSPQPIVSRLSTFSPKRAMAANSANPAAAPMNDSIQVNWRFQSGEARPSASRGQVIW